MLGYAILSIIESKNFHSQNVAFIAQGNVVSDATGSRQIMKNAAILADLTGYPDMETNYLQLLPKLPRATVKPAQQNANKP